MYVDIPENSGSGQPASLYGMPAGQTGRAIDRRILAVTSDLAFYRRLEHDFLCLYPSWLCQVADTSKKAQDYVNSTPPDALILDEEMSGAEELRSRASNSSEQTIFALRRSPKVGSTSGVFDQSRLIPLPQDVDPASVGEALSRTWALRSWMSCTVVGNLLSRIRKLPAIPELYAKISDELRQPECDLMEVGRLISRDPVMAAKILQVVNSVVFGLSFKVVDPAEAVLLLGTERTRSLILVASIFSKFDTQILKGISPEQVWGHSLQVGNFARTIALAETRNSTTADSAFIAGLFHDIGKLVLAGNVPDICRSVRELQLQRKCSLRAAELELMGTTHAELGACLLGSWGLPLPILEAVAWHHVPGRSADKSFSLLTAVHCANAFAAEAGRGSHVQTSIEIMDQDYLARIGLCAKRNVWRDFCGLPKKSGEEAQQEQIRRRQDARYN